MDMLEILGLLLSPALVSLLTRALGWRLPRLNTNWKAGFLSLVPQTVVPSTWSLLFFWLYYSLLGLDYSLCLSGRSSLGQVMGPSPSLNPSHNPEYVPEWQYTLTCMPLWSFTLKRSPEATRVFLFSRYEMLLLPCVGLGRNSTCSRKKSIPLPQRVSTC